jgi:hypothetical protein
VTLIAQTGDLTREWTVTVGYALLNQSDSPPLIPLKTRPVIQAYTGIHYRGPAGYRNYDSRSDKAKRKKRINKY